MPEKDLLREAKKLGLEISGQMSRVEVERFILSKSAEINSEPATANQKIPKGKVLLKYIAKAGSFRNKSGIWSRNKQSVVGEKEAITLACRYPGRFKILRDR